MNVLLRRSPAGLLLLLSLVLCSTAIPVADVDAQSRRAASAGDDFDEVLRRFEEQIAKMRDEFRAEVERMRAGGNAEMRGLRQRLEELERENAELKNVIREMRREMGARRGGDTDAGGERPRGMLGVSLSGTPEEMAEALKVKAADTLMVLTVQPESPAARMGLRPQDVITAFDGKEGGLEEFIEHMSAKKAGDEVVLTYARRQDSGDILRITGRTELMAWREPTEAAGGVPAIRIEPAPPPPVEPPTPAAPILLGVTVDETTAGVAVTTISEGSNAAAAKLQVGDRLIGFGEREVGSIDDLREAIGAARSGQEVALRFVRDGRTWVSVVRLSDRDGGAAHVSGPSPVGGRDPAPPADRAPGFLGVALEEQGGGLVVSEVVPDSAANQMGIEVGDRLISVNSNRVRTVEDLRGALSGLSAGDAISVALRRSGARMNVQGALGARPDGGEQGRVEPAPAPADAIVLVDTVVDVVETAAAAPAKPRGRLGIVAVEQDGAVLIESIEEGSAAGAAGARPGDRITSVQGRAVAGLEPITKILAQLHAGDRIALVLERDGRPIDLTVTLGGATEGRDSEESDSEVRTATASLPSETRAAPPRLGLEVEERADGLWVIAVEPRGAARRAGVVVGDRIVRCGETLVTDLPSMQQAVLRLTADRTAAFEVWRSNREHRLEVVPIAE